MDREIEIRVFERTEAADPNDFPDERDIYTLKKSIDLEDDNIFDVFDEAKIKAAALLESELEQEVAAQIEGLYNDSDYQEDRAKAQMYHKKFGDAL